MEETELVPHDSKFRQGDIMKLFGDIHADYGVIINADCDLANDKIDGFIAYVPLYTFKDYIERFWSSDQIKVITKQCKKDLGRFFTKESEIEELASWLNQGGVDEVVSQLVPHTGLKAKEQASLEKIIRKLHACLQGSSLKCLTAIYSLESDPEKHTQNQLASLKSNLGEGHLMISSVAGISDLGFVMRTKRVFSIDQALCFKSMAEHLLKSKDDDAVAAVRVARLASTYKYKAAQIFAQSFSRIGLSDEITRLNDLAIMEIVENLRKKDNA